MSRVAENDDDQALGNEFFSTGVLAVAIRIDPVSPVVSIVRGDVGRFSGDR
jgi:hypothetical protein